MKTSKSKKRSGRSGKVERLAGLPPAGCVGERGRQVTIANNTDAAKSVKVNGASIGKGNDIKAIRRMRSCSGRGGRIR